VISEELKKNKILSSVVDLYCIKPFDEKKFANFIRKHGNRIIAAEDHYPQGGIGEMLCSKLANTGIEIKCLNVKEIPHSGTSQELLEKYEIDSKAIEKAARII
jgi:transketolase